MGDQPLISDWLDLLINHTRRHGGLPAENHGADAQTVCRLITEHIQRERQEAYRQGWMVGIKEGSCRG